MPLISTGAGGGSDFEPVPAGTHMARCVSVVDFGFQETQHGPKPKVYLGFEIAGVRVEWEKDGKRHEGPALIGSTYNNSIHPKSVLGQHLVNWRGREFTDAERDGFDLFTIVGVPCMISVTHNVKAGKTYANVSGIMGAPPGVKVPKAEGDLLRYSASAPETLGDFDKLPAWMQKKCNASAPAPSAAPPQVPPPGHSPGPDDFDDDIPF